MLKLLRYIENSGVVSEPISYKWEPMLHMELAEKPPRNVKNAVEDVACNATFTFALGVAEWLWWRLSRLTTRVDARLYIEALWAASVDRRYLKKKRPEQAGDRSDPANGALCGAEVLLSVATTDARMNHPDRGKSFAKLTTVVRYTMPDTKPFDAWLKTTLDRFAKAFPYDAAKPGGPIVPRVFLDPDVPIDMKAISKLLDEQLQAIDYKNNPFLATPDELKAAGFEGTPYRYKG